MIQKTRGWWFVRVARCVAMVGCAAASVLPIRGEAAIIRVEGDGSGDFATVWQALEAAQHGDEVVVGTGWFNECTDEGETRRVQLWDKGVDLRGSGAGSGGTEISMLSIYTKQSMTISGVLFTDTVGPLLVNGDLGDDLEIYVNECTFKGNTSVAGAGGAVVGFGVAYQQNVIGVFENCRFEANTAEFGGGAISWDDKLLLQDCTFVANISDDGGAVFAESIEAHGCLFWRNEGIHAAAISVDGAIVENCTFWDNAGQTTLRVLGFHPAAIRRSIVGATRGGYGIDCTYSVEVSCCFLPLNDDGIRVYCILDDSPMDRDPRFCDPEEGNFALREGSPCAPGGDGNMSCGLIGAFDIGCGMTPVRMGSWGELKAIFR